ncbi:hypothetical protein [Nostoc sp. DSM 114167]
MKIEPQRAQSKDRIRSDRISHKLQRRILRMRKRSQHFDYAQ